MAAAKRTSTTAAPKKKTHTAKHSSTLEARIEALETAAGQQGELAEMVRDLFAIVKEQGRQLESLQGRR